MNLLDLTFLRGQMLPLILVDGPVSNFRTQVAEELSNLYHAMHARGNIATTPETYVRMMAQAIDNQRAVIIECSWVTQERHAHMLPEIAHTVFQKHMAQRRMLDRLALGRDALCVQAMDLNSTLMPYWGRLPIMDSLWATGWDEYLLVDIENMLCMKSNKGPGIGRFAPGEVVLLVGDQHGDTAQPYNVQRNIAFCSMSGKGCSEWLTEQLIAANISERDLYWINAREPKPGGGRATSWDFLDELMPKAIIALGDMAASWCRASGRPYEQVQHPQSWKRFHYREEYPLITMLQEILSGHTSDNKRKNLGDSQ